MSNEMNKANITMSNFEVHGENKTGDTQEEKKSTNLTQERMVRSGASGE